MSEQTKLPPRKLKQKKLPRKHPAAADPKPKKKKRRWTTEEDAKIIELRGKGMKWDDISNALRDCTSRPYINEL